MFLQVFIEGVLQICPMISFSGACLVSQQTAAARTLLANLEIIKLPISQLASNNKNYCIHIYFQVFCLFPHSCLRTTLCCRVFSRWGNEGRKEIMCYKYDHKIDNQAEICLSPQYVPFPQHHALIFPLYLTWYFGDSFSFIHLVTAISVGLINSFRKSCSSNSVDFPSLSVSTQIHSDTCTSLILLSLVHHGISQLQIYQLSLVSLVLPLSPVLKISHSWFMYYYHRPLFCLVMLISIWPKHWTLLWHFSSCFKLHLIFYVVTFSSYRQSLEEYFKVLLFPAPLQLQKYELRAPYLVLGWELSCFKTFL